MTEQEFIKTASKERERLLAIAHSYLHDWDAAADAVQETLTSLWVFRSRVDRTRNVASLLSTMVKNVCLMHLRKERLLIDHLTINVPSSGNPHSDMEARERAEIVKKAMEGLSAQHQSVLHMFYSAELSINQIATIRNTTPTAVKQMLLRARNALRDEIERRNP